MSYPTSLDSFPSASELHAGKLNTPTSHSDAHEDITDAIGALETKVGIDSSTDDDSHDFKLASLAARKQINVQDLGVTPANTGASNKALFNAAEVAELGACDFVFPPGTYDTDGFDLTVSYHRLVSPTMFGATINYTGSGTGGQAVYIHGITAGGYDGRLMGCGISGFYIVNDGSANNRALKIRHATDCWFEHLKIQLFRGDGAVEASNFADSTFFHVDWQYCSSTDDSDKPVINFNYDSNGVWAVDQITFLRCKFEVNGDKLVDLTSSGGFYINKIWFSLCKFESSGTESYKLGGSTGSSGGQFWFSSCQDIVFDRCDFTLQQLRSGHAILPCIIRVKGTSTVKLSGVSFNYGSTTQKCFTNFVVCDATAQLLVINDVWCNSGDGTGAADPTVVIKATNSPRLSQKSFGFTPNTGGSKVATDWYTSAEWASGGVLG